MSDSLAPQDAANSRYERAYEEGRRAGLATAALATSVVAFISLLGLEKAILAGVLGILAIRGTGAASRGRRLGLAAVGVAGVYAITFVIVLVVFRDRLAELFRLLQQMG